MIGLMRNDGSVDVFLVSMVLFLWEVAVILGNGCGIQGQKLHGYREVKCQSETISWEGEYKLALKFGYWEPSVKKMWGETEGLMLLFWKALFVGGRVVR